MNLDKQTMIDVSLVFPAYNEAERLEHSVEKVTMALRQVTSAFEIIIAEDGSKDGTDTLAQALAGKYSFVRHIHSEKRLGRGVALTNAFKQANGNVLVYMDVDLATDLKYLKPLIDAVAVEGYDFATGSRMLPQSRADRSAQRRLSSWTYNALVRLMLNSKLKDHQCGFKAFKREALLPLLHEVKAKHWFWDTEVLVRAARKGYRIREIPVEWKSSQRTKVRLVKDSITMGWQVLKLRLQLSP
jgi:glycosyltransferase involved in cell wall biosynthesis